MTKKPTRLHTIKNDYTPKELGPERVDMAGWEAHKQLTLTGDPT